MVTYIYFVKCPNCEDAHFDFFDDAKGFAMGCLSKKPIITQTEVCRNDFGECTDHCDLGTVWSWEDECKDCHEPVEEPTFTKDEIVADYKPDTDPEFVDDDSDFRFVNDMTESLNGADLDEIKKLCDEIGIITMYDLHSFMKETGATDDTLVAKLRAYRDELGPDFKIKESVEEAAKLKTWICFYEGRDIGTVQAATEDEAIEQMMIEHPGLIYNNTDWFVEPEDAEDFVEESCSRKPVPEGMTIEQLVETMEENEDEVECTWCNELFPKDMCKKEVNLGYLCPRCADGIMSRGETLTFKENNYWDFLDEKFDIDFEDEASSDMLDVTSDAIADEEFFNQDFEEAIDINIPDEVLANCLDNGPAEIWGVEHVKDDIYKIVLLKRYDSVNYRHYEVDLQEIHDEMYDLDGLFLFTFMKDGSPELDSWNVDVKNQLGACRLDFEDPKYEDVVAKAWRLK